MISMTKVFSTWI